MIAVRSTQGKVQPVETVMANNSSDVPPWERLEVRGSHAGYSGSGGPGLDILYWQENERLALWVIVRRAPDGSRLSRDVMVEIAEALVVHGRD